MEEKISLKEILSYFWKKKILALIIIVVTFIVTFAGLSFYNNSGIVYISNVRLTWTGYEDDQYPDSSKFNYTKIIGLDNLEKAKASNESFSNINVERMVEKGLIEITEVDQYVDKVLTGTYYTIEVSSSCFNSKNQASAFVLAIIEAHEDYVRDIINYMDADNTLATIDEETEYEEMFTKLANQKNNIYSLISKLQQVRSLDFVYDQESGKSIRWIKKELQVLYDSYAYDQLPYRYISENLVRNADTFTENFENKLLAIEIQIQQKQAYLDQLKNQFANSNTIYGDDYLNSVMELVSEIESLKNKQTYLVACLANPTEDALYEAEVNKIYEKLEELTEEIVKAQKVVYEDEIDHTFSGAQIIKEDEPIGTIMSGVIALGISVVLCAGVIIIKAMLNNSKSLVKKEAKEEK